MLALALAVLLGTTLGVHEGMQDTTATLADVVDLEPAVEARHTSTAFDHGGGAGDKLDLPHAVFARALPLQLAHADSEPPLRPAWRRAARPLPEQLLRPPDA